MNVVTRGIRNAFRNATRTIAIVTILGLSIGLSLVMLTAHQTVQNKIKTSLTSIGSTVTIRAAGWVTMSGANQYLTTDESNRIQQLPHVTGLSELLNGIARPIGTTGIATPAGAIVHSSTRPGFHLYQTNLQSPIKVTNSNKLSNLETVGGGSPKLPSNFSLTIPFAGTNDPTDPANIDASSLTIVSGKAIDGSAATYDAMVSSAMAAKNDLHVGSTFTAFNKTFTVAAIFKGNTETGNNSVIVSLPTIQDLTGRKGDVQSAVATADSLTNLNAVTSEIKSALGSAVDVTSNITDANGALQPLNGVKSVSFYSLIGAVVAGAIIILLSMVMIVRERKREIGILKAIGFSNARVMFQFVSEALTFAVIGAVIGLALAVFTSSPVTSSLVGHSGASKAPANPLAPLSPLGNIKDVHAQVGFAVVLFAIGAAILIALVGSAVTSYFVSRVRPAEVLRSE